MRDALHKKGELEVRELEGVVVTEQDYQGVQLAEQLGLLGKEIRIRIKRGGET